MDDDAAMLAELDAEMGIAPVNPAIKAEELKVSIQESKQKALQAKKAGDQATALNFVKQFKAQQAELDELIALNPQLAQPAAPQQV